MRKLLAAALCMMTVLAIGGAAQASAHGLNAPKSYFCTKHPNNPNCIKVHPSRVPSTGGGGTFANAGSVPVVYGIAGSPHAANSHAAAVTQLPPSGGAASLSGGANPARTPDRTPLYMLLGLVAATAGGGMRMLARRAN